MTNPASHRRPADEARARLFRDFVRIRWAILPLVVTFGFVVAAMDPATWRWLLLLGAVTAVVALSLYEHSQAAGAPPTGHVGRSLVAVTAIQLAVAGATGGLVSPGVLATMLVAFTASVVDVSRAARLAILALQVAGFFTFAALQTSGALAAFVPGLFAGMAEVGPAVGPWLVATFYVLVAVVAFGAGSRVGRVLQAAYLERIEQREQTLRLLRTKATQLTELSSEVAHELKNPLASVKGLAAVLSPHLDGREAERMRVLRAEVDRMQGVLEALSTLTRPLVPLRAVHLDLSDLVHDVVELHTGLAAECGVTLDIAAVASVDLWCDADKVHQTLMNLLQNALEATPRARTVTVSLAADGDGARVDIRDEGPGLPPDLLSKAFLRGVTTKSEGSGLGLTLARAFAQQHGGEVSLVNRTEGGCRATLRLPARPAEVTP